MLFNLRDLLYNTKINFPEEFALISLLARIFIKDHKNYMKQNVRLGYVKLCGIVGLCLNILLVVIKLIAGRLSDSMAITADAFNHISDAGSYLIAMLFMILAAKKPDKEHPYGHGRIEYMSSAVISALILTMAIELFRESFAKISAPVSVLANPAAVGIMVFSILLKAYMYAYSKSIGEKTDSPGLKAVALDSIADCITSTVVILSVLLSKPLGFNLDAFGGMAVSIFIGFTGLRLAKGTVSSLLGEQPEPELLEDINKVLESYPDMIMPHEILVHSYGPGRLFISLHVIMLVDEGKIDVFEIHDRIESAELSLREALGCEAIIHMDPIKKNEVRETSINKLIYEKKGSRLLYRE